MLSNKRKITAVKPTIHQNKRKIAVKPTIHQNSRVSKALLGKF